MIRGALAFGLLAAALAQPSSAAAAPLYGAWDLLDDVIAANETVTGRWLTEVEGAVVGSLGATRTFELLATTSLAAKASRSSFEVVARGRNSAGSTVARYAGVLSSPVPPTRKSHALLTRYLATQTGESGNFLTSEAADELNLSVRPVLVEGLGNVLTLSGSLGLAPKSWFGKLISVGHGDLSLMPKVRAAGGTASGLFQGQTLTLTVSVPQNARAKELVPLRGALITLGADAKTYRLTSVSIAAADLALEGERVKTFLLSSRYLGTATSTSFANPKKPLTLKALTRALGRFAASL